MQKKPINKEEKPSFTSVPKDLRQDIERIVGSFIVQADIAYGGFSASASYILTFENEDRIFAKGTYPGDPSHGTQHLRQEIYAYKRVPVLYDVAPKYLGCVSDGDEDGWMLGLWEHITQNESVPPLDKAMNYLAKIHAADSSALSSYTEVNFIQSFFTPEKKWRRLYEADVRTAFTELFLNPEACEVWLDKHLRFFIDAQAKLTPERFLSNAKAYGFMHGDLRLDNIIHSKIGRVFFVDWPNAARGPTAFDVLTLGASFALEVGSSWTSVLDAYTQAGGVLPGQDDLVLLALSLSGYYAEQMRRPIPKKMPRIRLLQAGLLTNLITFLAQNADIGVLPDLDLGLLQRSESTI